jgi:hypothetical protein
MFVLFLRVSSFNLFTLVVDILRIFEKAAHSVRVVSQTDRYADRQICRQTDREIRDRERGREGGREGGRERERDGHTYGFRRRQTHSALVHIHLHTYV